jgi:hypothetical protein
MSKLTGLRIVRWALGRGQDGERPHLEALIEREAAKMKDGYHYARWIVPLVGVVLAGGLFLPLALALHPLFWLGVGLSTVLGLGLGATFHALARRISPAQLLLRKRCLALGQRLSSIRNLLGMQPALSSGVAEVLEEAARVYLAAVPETEATDRRPSDRPRAEAVHRARLGMDDAMAQMLALAEPESPQAQDAELLRGWAEPLLEEMRATATALAAQERREHWAAQVETPSSPLAGLAGARADLERLEAAESELDRLHN